MIQPSPAGMPPGFMARERACISYGLLSVAALAAAVFVAAFLCAPFANANERDSGLNAKEASVILAQVFPPYREEFPPGPDDEKPSYDSAHPPKMVVPPHSWGQFLRRDTPKDLERQEEKQNKFITDSYNDALQGTPVPRSVLPDPAP